MTLSATFLQPFQPYLETHLILSQLLASRGLLFFSNLLIVPSSLTTNPDCVKDGLFSTGYQLNFRYPKMAANFMLIQLFRDIDFILFLKS